MCGIAVIVDRGQPAAADDLDAMLDAIAHRGPDGRGVWREGGVGLGHVRLAVIDLHPEADQPFVSGDGELLLVYNGEIYNYLELRRELEAAGHRFRTRSDTEVLLAAYRQWGAALCSRLNGMWAFAVYDRRRRTLFCSRDRFGVKPLYYARVGDRLLFASEVKALLAAERELAALDGDAASLLLRASIAAARENHFCRGVKRFPAAHNMHLDCAGGAQPVFSRYWDYPTDIDGGISFDAACERLRALLLDAIRLRMRADVPVGTTLSGGVDSSSIVCLLRALRIDAHDTFTAHFPALPAVPAGAAAFDEAAAARALAAELGFRHHAVPPPTDFLETLGRIVHHMDGPTECPATVPLWAIMRAMRGRIVVCLEGQGADELLGGYYQLFAPRAMADAARAGRWREAGAMLRAMPGSAGGTVGGIGRAALELARAALPRSHRAWRRWRGDENVYAGILAGGPDRAADRGDAPRYAECLANGLRKRHEGELASLLHYGDAISMAHSIESRLPFMDYRLVEFAFRLPGAFKLRSGVGKALLREAMRGHVPDRILDHRAKLGFVVPIREWFREAPEELVYPVLLDDRCRRRGLFDPAALERALRRHAAGAVDLSSQIFRWLTLELWCIATLDRASA